MHKGRPFSSISSCRRLKGTDILFCTCINRVQGQTIFWLGVTVFAIAVKFIRRDLLNSFSSVLIKWSIFSARNLDDMKIIVCKERGAMAFDTSTLADNKDWGGGLLC